MIYGSPFIPNFAKGTTALGGAETHFVCQEGCMNWVKSCPDGPEVQLPLYPRKRTQVGHRAMPEKCQQRSMRRSSPALTRLQFPVCLSQIRNLSGIPRRMKETLYDRLGSKRAHMLSPTLKDQAA